MSRLPKVDLKHERFNSGILTYGSIKSIYTVDTKKKTGEEFIPKGELYFKQLSAREGDIMTANTFGYKIDKKIQTHYIEDVSKKDKAMINNVLYDIVSLDNDEKFLYLYLQKVGG